MVRDIGIFDMLLLPVSDQINISRRSPYEIEHDFLEVSCTFRNEQVTISLVKLNSMVTNSLLVPVNLYRFTIIIVFDKENCFKGILRVCIDQLKVEV